MKTPLIVFFCFLATASYSQPSLEFAPAVKEIQLQYLDLISLDTGDQIYASNTSGDVYLFDRNGRQLNVFSPRRQGRLNQLEAAWTVNIFSFSSDLQEYRIMDRFLNPIAENSLLLNDITLPRASTLGNNNVIWVWDESDLSIKSLDYLRNIVLQSLPLTMILDSENLQVSEIREFKNRLFINVPESGIFILDNQGNFIRKVNLQIDQRMCFYKENLFWIEKKKLMMYNITLEAIFDLGILPEDDIEYVSIGRDIMVFAKKDLIKIYPLPDGLGRMRQ
jgi:hypothetical protein